MGLFNKPKIDLIINEMPTAVTDENTERHDLVLKATVVVKSTQKLAQEVAKITFRGERATPGVTSAVFSAAGNDQIKATLCEEIKKVKLSRRSQEGNEFIYEASFEFIIPKNAPGSLCPIAKGSSSIRYFLIAECSTSKFGGSSTCCKELHFFRACRDDARDLDTFVDETGIYQDCLNYEIWSMKAVCCGGQARFQVCLSPLRGDINFSSVVVTLKEKQIVRTIVPAAYQTRPGQTQDIESTFDLVSRTVNVTPNASRSTSRTTKEDIPDPTRMLFDLSLPTSTQAFRRSSATKGGIRLEHFFELSFAVSNSEGPMVPLKVRCDTSLVLPLDYVNYHPDLQPIDVLAPREVMVAPPAYGEFAPPNYGDHEIDAVYQGGETVRTGSVSDVAFD